MIEEEIVRQESNAVLSQKIIPQQSTPVTPQSINSIHQRERQKIFLITEGIRSKKTQITYQRYFNHFLDHIKIHDFEVLLNFSPKVIKQMLVDYILYLRDEKNLSRSTISGYLAAILHFFQINNDEFTLTIRNFKIHLPSDDSISGDRP
jgi:Phage integrase, N-terminal SAM-like domain